MPYRRLPNTDIARLKAMKTALEKGEDIPPFKLAYSQICLQQLKQFCPQFENILNQQRLSYDAQILKSKDYSNITRKARLYISHFLQVLNLAILRGDLPPTARKFYNLKENDTRIPTLTADSDLVYWGEKIIKGEADRIASGGNPMTNPTSALVRVRYEQFIDALRYQKTLQNATGYASDKISGMRAEADTLIHRIWDEVEATFELLPEESRRDKAAYYGIAYVMRTGELSAGSGEIVSAEEVQNTEELMSNNHLADERQKLLEDNRKKESEISPAGEELKYSLFSTIN
jgi:hypothetical protein